MKNIDLTFITNEHSQIVWKAVKERLPEIKMAAGKMLKDLNAKIPE